MGSKPKSRHLLIDGYNIIHAWPDMRKAFKRGWEAATGLLTERVGVLYLIEDYYVTLVFDGQGEDISTEHPTKDEAFTVLYTPSGISADAVIEQLVNTGKKRIEFTVATQDQVLANMVRARGAWVIDPEELSRWIERASERQSRLIKYHTEKQEDTSSPWDALDG